MAQPGVYTNGRKSTATPEPSRNSPTTSAALKKKFYGVQVGREPGVYNTWDECLNQVRGHKGALFQAFPTIHQAQAYVKGEITANINTAKQPGEQKFYAVQVGRVPGVYNDWPSAQAQIVGIKGPRHKKFNARAEAEAFVAQGRKLQAVNNVSVEVDQQHPEKRRKIEMINCSAPGLVTNGTYIPADANGNVFEPGTGPLPPGAEDGFDPNIKLTIDGNVVNKTEAEKAKTKLQSKERDPPSMLKIYTDGSSLRNGTAGARAGVGVFFGPEDPKNVSEALKGTRQTNQRAELTAVLRALDIAPRHRDVTIYTDSRYAIDCVTNWYKNWVRNNWQTAKNKPVENKDLIMEIRDKIEERDLLRRGTFFVWVKGHASDEGNIAADKLANAGAVMGRGVSREDEIEEAKEKEIIVSGKMKAAGEVRRVGNDGEADEAFRVMEEANAGAPR